MQNKYVYPELGIITSFMNFRQGQGKVISEPQYYIMLCGVEEKQNNDQIETIRVNLISGQVRDPAPGC